MQVFKFDVQAPRFIDDPFLKLITFRAALAGVAAFAASVVLGPRIIRFLRARKIGEQTERRDSKRLDRMMASKKDTPTMGGVFVIEAFSSLLQIVAFKTTGRRVFRIAPLHHHFQFGGVPETKITLRFWVVAALLAVAGISLLKLR